MSVLISVTAANIVMGLRKHCERCPVALAVEPHLKPWLKPYVTSTVIEICRKNPFLRCLAIVQIPEKVIDFMYDFDFSCPRPKWEPFEFELDIPGEYLAEVAA